MVSVAKRVTYILAFYMALERYRQHADLSLGTAGTIELLRLIAGRTVRPSARRKWNEMEYGAYIASRNRYAVLHIPPARARSFA